MASGGCLLVFFLVILMEIYGGMSRKPFNVSYDHRSILIDGHRRMLISAGIHYPRATPEMWPGILQKAKDGGANVIQTYVFWNGHEPVKGQYYFSGRYNLPKFAKLVNDAGLFLHLRIGPYACAEWNFGGFPVWLRDIPDIVFRTNNTAFQEEMSKFVEKIVSLMKEKSLFSWQGGPIILAQIENEYGDVEHSFGKGGKEYVKWAATLAQDLDIGVPWVMCKQNDAPSSVINACNGFYCDGFKPNAVEKPSLWTEDWNGWYTSWGDPIPERPVEDNAFAVARFFQRGGSFHNYYMYYGGTNFGHTSGGPFVTTSYDYDAPIDEYGLLRQPKWGHLKELHTALKLCEAALVAVDHPMYMSLGPEQEAHIYGASSSDQAVDYTLKGSDACAAFLANVDAVKAAEVHFNGKTFELPPWSVSILPDCKNVAFNTAKVNAQTSVLKMGKFSPNGDIGHDDKHLQRRGQIQDSELSWEHYIETVGVWNDASFSATGLLDHLSVTKDVTDYLWYLGKVEVLNHSGARLPNGANEMVLHIEAMRDAVSIFVNGHFSGSVMANTAETWVPVKQIIELKAGLNEIALLSSTVGLQNYGAFLERDGAGIQGSVFLTGLLPDDINLTSTEWVYQVGLRGESFQIFTREGQNKVSWSSLTDDVQKTPITWYKTKFDAPGGDDPIALDLGSMGKGEAWVNGKSLGRYWPAFKVNATTCSDTCDYRGPYSSSKCVRGCGEPTQQWYHIPRSWLRPEDNVLILFEEIGGDISQVSLLRHYQDTVCAHVSESQPSVNMWLAKQRNMNFSSGGMSELQLDCGEGNVIHKILFASFGNPFGKCGNFQQGHCHSAKTKSLVEAACVGHRHCSLNVEATNFGDDPCPGMEKSLAIEAKCSNQIELAQSI